MAEPSGIEEEGNDLFYFESDHLAVKGNRDYSELLKTLFVLQAQQQRAIKVYIIQVMISSFIYVFQDFEKVERIKQECLQDPLGTVERVRNGEDLGIPDLQVIAEVCYDSCTVRYYYIKEI